MTNVSDKSCRESKHTFYAQKLCFENRNIYEIMWKGIAESGRPLMKI
jgi:hypothetical protein